MLSRRQVLTVIAASPLLRGATFAKPLGINLYTVRDALTAVLSARHVSGTASGIRAEATLPEAPTVTGKQVVALLQDLRTLAVVSVGSVALEV